MVSGAGLCCLMYCGAEDTGEPSPLLPQSAEALGPGDGACPQGLTGKMKGCQVAMEQKRRGEPRQPPGRYPARGEP